MNPENNKEILEEKNELKEEEQAVEATLVEEKELETKAKEEASKEVIDVDAKVVEETPVAEEAPAEEEKKLDTKPEDPVSISNHTLFSKDGYTQMNKELAKKSYILIIVCEVILAAIDVWLYIQQKYLVAGFLSGLIVVYPFLIVLMSKRQLARTFKTYDKIFNSATYDYEFKTEQVNLTFTASSQSTLGIIKYNTLYNVIENDKYFFLFISSNQSYIVDKEGFGNPNNIDTVRELIKSKGVRYSDKRKYNKEEK